jgi:hypothetical protein
VQTFDDVLKNKVAKEDTGAGLFAAITHLNKACTLSVVSVR